MVKREFVLYTATAGTMTHADERRLGPDWTAVSPLSSSRYLDDEILTRTHISREDISRCLSRKGETNEANCSEPRWGPIIKVALRDLVTQNAGATFLSTIQSMVAMGGERAP